MKPLSVLLALLILTVSTSFAKPKKPKPDYKIISIKRHSLYFKVDKSFVGGRMEIYNASGEFMEADDLPHTHTVIYFEEMPEGSYVLKVIKGSKVAAFTFKI
ncbi:MAG: hypothetical protein HY015_00555 [Bacteroidetes bacterium]|nr:hypothetical protein [Bacteroidota bacterium]MBI3481468.1 hypothetical protein [Bacteroidota bacterium]